MHESSHDSPSPDSAQQVAPAPLPSNALFAPVQSSEQAQSNATALDVSHPISTNAIELTMQESAPRAQVAPVPNPASDPATVTVPVQIPCEAEQPQAIGTGTGLDAASAHTNMSSASDGAGGQVQVVPEEEMPPTLIGKIQWYAAFRFLSPFRKLCALCILACYSVFSAATIALSGFKLHFKYQDTCDQLKSYGQDYCESVDFCKWTSGDSGSASSCAIGGGLNFVTGAASFVACAAMWLGLFVFCFFFKEQPCPGHPISQLQRAIGVWPQHDNWQIQPVHLNTILDSSWSLLLYYRCPPYRPQLLAAVNGNQFTWWDLGRGVVVALISTIYSIGWLVVIGPSSENSGLRGFTIFTTVIGTILSILTIVSCFRKFFNVRRQAYVNMNDEVKK